MTDPGSQDDSWDELARELGLEKSAPQEHNEVPEAAGASEEHAEFEDEGEEDALAFENAHGDDQHDESSESFSDHETAGYTADDAEALGDDADGDLEDGEGSDSENGEGEGDGPGGEGQSADGQPGTGRKRRRRRRRRKKGGAVGAAEAAEAVEPAAVEEPEVAQPIPVTNIRLRRDEYEDVVQDDDEEMDNEGESSGRPLAAEEDTGGEVLRELIATWNVPSWDDIVTGLYRPER